MFTALTGSDDIFWAKWSVYPRGKIAVYPLLPKVTVIRTGSLRVLLWVFADHSEEKRAPRQLCAVPLSPCAPLCHLHYLTIYTTRPLPPSPAPVKRWPLTINSVLRMGVSYCEAAEVRGVLIGTEEVSGSVTLAKQRGMARGRGDGASWGRDVHYAARPLVRNLQ